MANSQNYPGGVETIIRQAEQDEAKAMLSGDIKALDDLWTDELLAYSTSNLYARKPVLLNLIANGGLRLRDHQRTTLEVVIDGDRALAVGHESSRFEGAAAGKIMLCSYLNVWALRSDRWRLLGRHVGLMSLIDADP